MILTKQLKVDSASLKRGTANQIFTTIQASQDFFYKSEFVLDLSRPPLQCVVEELFKHDACLEVVLKPAILSFNQVRAGNLRESRVISHSGQEHLSHTVSFVLNNDDAWHGAVYPPRMFLNFKLTAEEFKNLCASEQIKKGSPWGVSLQLIPSVALLKSA